MTIIKHRFKNINNHVYNKYNNTELYREIKNQTKFIKIDVQSSTLIIKT